MTDTVFLALGLVLVFEGLMPFAAPATWRSAVVRLARMRDGQIRFVGLGALVAGALLILI